MFHREKVHERQCDQRAERLRDAVVAWSAAWKELKEALKYLQVPPSFDRPMAVEIQELTRWEATELYLLSLRIVHDATPAEK